MQKEIIVLPKPLIRINVQKENAELSKEKKFIIVTNDNIKKNWMSVKREPVNIPYYETESV